MSCHRHQVATVVCIAVVGWLSASAQGQRRMFPVRAGTRGGQSIRWLREQVDRNAARMPNGLKQAHLDIKPGSCPNPVNPRSRGVVPLAIVGGDSFDVTQIDAGTVTLRRADGVGGAVMPLSAPPGPGITTDDVATPFTGDLCDCHGLGSDGIDDLLLKFSTPELVGAFQLSEFPSGASLMLILSGSLLDGTAFEASDCVVIPGSGGRGGRKPVCGNHIVESGEQCDPPNGVTCDDNCQLIPGDHPANDSCANPTQVSDGPTSYSNLGATTDGPVEGGLCAVVDVTSDVWFCYEATCDGFVSVNLCAATFDTTLALYDGCACPTAPAIACSDDDCQFGLGSLVSVPAQAGQSFLIRVGGFADDRGDGSLVLVCGDEPDTGGSVCGGVGTGECFSEHASPGCSDEPCCRAVCTVDPFCCEAEWDDQCVCEAGTVCAGNFQVCTTSTDGCASPHTDPGCADLACCQDVCASNPFCCCVEWDDICVEAARSCP